MSLGGDLHTHPFASAPFGYYMRRQLCEPSTRFIQLRWRCCYPLRPLQSKISRSERTPPCGNISLHLFEKAEINMPRSFLVKKYFSNKKPCYKESQLESQTGKLFSLTEVERLDLSCRVNPRHSLKES